MNELFFNPTPINKEFMILQFISRGGNITQREIASFIDVSATMVNSYLDKYEKDGLINKYYKSRKVISYSITSLGEERIEQLNDSYYNSILSVYNNAKRNIVPFLDSIVNNEIKDVIIYGAGEMCELILMVINNDYKNVINVTGLIDDDLDKIGKSLLNVTIHSINDIDLLKFDGVIISTKKNINHIKEELNKKNINENIIFAY